jgi:hypothetical protein
MHIRKPGWLTWRLAVLSGVLCAILVIAQFAGVYTYYFYDYRYQYASSLIELAFLTSPIIFLAFLVVVYIVLSELTSTFVLREEEEPGDPPASRSELNTLLNLKERGDLLSRSFRVRERASRTSHYTPDVSTAIQAQPRRPARPENALDRLQRLKHAGVWNPRSAEPG